MASHFLNDTGLGYLWAKIVAAITTSSSEVEKKIPTKTSDLSNDSGFITGNDIPEGAAASTTTPKMDEGSGDVGSEMAFARGDHVHPTDTSRLATTGDASKTTVAFTAAATRTKIVSGETQETIAGKILKYMNDMGDMAFKSSVDKTDLSAAVQTSLGKADTALQSFTETDPTVPAWAKAATKPTYTAEEIGALSVADAQANYAKKSDISTVYKWKGSKATYEDLPADGNEIGDVWDVASDGKNYGWTGTAWDSLGGDLQVEAITNEEIDTIIAGAST